MDYTIVYTTIGTIVLGLIGLFSEKRKHKSEIDKLLLESQNKKDNQLNATLSNFSTDFIKRIETDNEAIRKKEIEHKKLIETLSNEKDELSLTLAETKGENRILLRDAPRKEILEKQRQYLLGEVERLKLVRGKLLNRISGETPLIIALSNTEKKMGVIYSVLRDDNRITYGIFDVDNFVPHDIAIMNISTFNTYYSRKFDTDDEAKFVWLSGDDANNLREVIDDNSTSHNKNVLSPLLMPIRFE